MLKNRIFQHICCRATDNCSGRRPNVKLCLERQMEWGQNKAWPLRLVAAATCVGSSHVDQAGRRVFPEEHKGGGIGDGANIQRLDVLQCQKSKSN